MKNSSSHAKRNMRNSKWIFAQLASFNRRRSQSFHFSCMCKLVRRISMILSNICRPKSKWLVFGGYAINIVIEDILVTTQHIEKTLYAKPYRLKNWSAKKIVHIMTLLDQKEIWKFYVTSHFLGNVMLKLNLKINDFLIYF